MVTTIADVIMFAALRVFNGLLGPEEVLWEWRRKEWVDDKG